MSDNDQTKPEAKKPAKRPIQLAAPETIQAAIPTFTREDLLHCANAAQALRKAKFDSMDLATAQAYLTSFTWLSALRDRMVQQFQAAGVPQGNENK